MLKGGHSPETYPVMIRLIYYRQHRKELIKEPSLVELSHGFERK
jgi:hypothetical protein